MGQGRNGRGLRGNGIRRGALAVLALLLTTPARAEPAPTPALWVVRDTDTTIYLFGTFHTLGGAPDWFSGPVRSAFERSESLVLETLVPERRRALPASRLTPETRISGAAAAPFLKATRAVNATGRSLGWSPDQGADAVLRRTAEAEAKPVVGLEAFQRQVTILASISAPSTPAAAPPPKAVAAALSALLAEWEAGRTDGFATMVDGLSVEAPKTWRTLLANRNLCWAEWIDQRMARPGTVFVAVGAAHLAGRGSVQQRLAEQGYPVLRVH